MNQQLSRSLSEAGAMDEGIRNQLSEAANE